MKIPVYDFTGTKVDDTTLAKTVFEAKINEPLMAQAVRVFLSNQRAANAHAQTRAEVNRTGKKIYRQKGTGGARHGSRKAPIYVGGGKALGPTGEQNYSLKMSKNMKTAALKSALSQAAKEGQITAITGMTTLNKPKTKQAQELVDRMFDGKARKIAFIVTKDMDKAVKSVRNLKNTDWYFVQSLNTYDVVNHTQIIFSVEALEELQTRLA